MARNKYGQYTSVNNIEMKITKHLQTVANQINIRIKPLVRDELEKTLREEIYASYTPATKKGKDVQEYNESHVHQKKRPYHHTGILARSIQGRIDGDKIIAGPMDGVTYPNGTTAKEVYNYLKFGTSDTAKSKVYSYGKNNEDFSQYISQNPHNFEARTRSRMAIFFNDLANELKTNSKKYEKLYYKKR